MKLLSLFSGVGGLDAAVEAAFGARVVAHCEADAYCRMVLARHWPGVPCFADVCKLTAADVGEIDCICGGFPCTDLSVAGKQEGLSAARSGLWFEYLRLVRELLPSLVVIENVPPLYRTLEWRRQVQEPLEALGYRVLWTLCKASDVGAPHRRERTFALAVRAGAKVPMLAATEPQAQDGVLWPTPAAMIPNDGEDLASWEARRQATKARVKNGNGFGTPLSIAVALWATASVACALAGQTSRGGKRKDELLLGGQVQLWATPTCRDKESPAKLARGAGSQAAGQERIAPLGVQVTLWATPHAHEPRLGYQRRRPGAKGTQISLTTQVLEVAGKAPVNGKSVAALNPDWVEPLMGMPVGWTQPEGDRQDIDPVQHWPMGQGVEQHEWEPPRVVQHKDSPNRRKRLMALGNAVVPQQAMLALARLAAAANDRRQSAMGSVQGVLI